MMDIESKNKASDQYSINSMQTSKVQENIPTEDRDKNKNVYIERYIIYEYLYLLLFSYSCYSLFLSRGTIFLRRLSSNYILKLFIMCTIFITVHWIWHPRSFFSGFFTAHFIIAPFDLETILSFNAMSL